MKLSVERFKKITERADQVLLGLSHSKQAIPALLKQTLQRIDNNPNDIVGRVSRQVLERAETVRKQLIEKAEASDSTAARWVPDWLKDMTFVADTASAPAASMAAGLGKEDAEVAIEELAVAAKPARAQALRKTASKTEKAVKKTTAKPRKKKV